MPELNGLEATRQIRRAVPAAILIVTMHESDRMVSAIVQAGATGYISKSEAGPALVDAVRTVLASEKAPAGREQDPARTTSAKAGASIRRTPFSALTPREREVLQLLAEGRSNKEIGVALGITTKTAETHRARILAKLDLHSMSELVRYAIRNQVIEA
jgi:DNA-binding NarL/FixJ family response regulator